MIVKDALAGIYKNKKETITVEEYNKLLRKLEELEYTITALKLVNTDLTEAIKSNTIPSQDKKDNRRNHSYIC
jgi:hypothetical protein